MTDSVGSRADLSSAIGVDIGEDLLELALTHRSFSYENGGVANNERLEFLGDSILGQAVTVMLYRENPDLDEGDLASAGQASCQRWPLPRSPARSGSAPTCGSDAARS